MAHDADPYRILGLPRGAPLADVKKAYRRLAKTHHPDAAGEAALPRFLAIQAAYDQIVGAGSNGSGPSRPGARRPWDADPARADATYRAYGGRARRPRADGTRRATGTRPRTGASGPTGTAGDAAPGGPGGVGSTGPRRGTSGTGRPSSDAGSAGGSGSSAGGSGRSSRARKKATLGSTSYDGVEAEPFEPDWGGASWYGTTSGTYWTLNPKEYADPRKHGPEYQARARRAAATPAGDDVSADDASTDPRAGAEPASSGAAATAGHAPLSGDPAAGPPPTHTTASWWAATAASDGAGSEEPGARSDGRTPADDMDAADMASPSTASSAAPVGRAADVGDTGAWAWLEGAHPGPASRLARGVIGWVPVALVLGWTGGELTGCRGAAATCDPGMSTIVWLSQVLALVGLVLLPRLASLAAIAALVALAAAIPATLIVNAPRGDDAPPNTVIPAAIAAIAWFVGAGLALARARRPPAAPVS